MSDVENKVTTKTGPTMPRITREMCNEFIKRLRKHGERKVGASK